MAHQHRQLVAEVRAEHLRAVGADGEADAAVHERPDHSAELCVRAQHPGVEVRARADLQHGPPLPQHRQHARVLRAADAVADAIRLERLEGLAHLVGPAGLAGVDGEAQPGSPALTKDLGVVGEAEAVRLGPGDVDADDPAAAPGDRLGGDDLVQRRGEAAVEAEDQAGADLRVFEHGAVHPTHRRGDDVVQVLLAAAVALHRVEAQLELRDVVLAVGAADHLVDAALHGDRARLDQLRPVEEVEVGVEALAPASDGDQVAERPVVLGRQPDALGVGDAPHDRRRDRRAEVHVELAQRHAWIEALARHQAPQAGFVGGV